jgi:hypothetical protein
MDLAETFTISCYDADHDDRLVGTVNIKGSKYLCGATQIFMVASGRLEKILQQESGVERWYPLREKHLNIGGKKLDLGEICLKFTSNSKSNVTVIPTTCSVLVLGMFYS